MNQSIARALLDIGAVTFSPEAPYTFKSGIRSPVYVDNRVLVYHPKEWRVIIDGFKALICNQDIRFDLVAGVAVGGVPHSSALAYTMQKPSVFIRGESKEHGKEKLIEGGDVARQLAMLVEDHVTTGGSSLRAVQALRHDQATVRDVLAIISYGFSQAESDFEDNGLSLHTLTDFDTLLNLARERGDIRDQHIDLIRRWFANPRVWGKEYA